MPDRARRSRRLQLKRVYEQPGPTDGMRVLVDRLWPRGLSRQQVRADLWLRDAAPSAELRRWYVRFTCDTRDATTIYFDLHQRTLRYEVYFLPIPPVPTVELYEFLLRRNHPTYGARFSLGPEGDIYLTGRVALEHLDVVELDRIIGVLYELTERWFRPVVQLAYPARSAKGDQGVAP